MAETRAYEAVGTFVTIFYAVYDAASGILRYSNAGHTPPLLWNSRENRVERMYVPGVLAGVKPNIVFEEKQVELEPGDVVLLSTDGARDAQNEEKKMIGAGFLNDILTAHHDFDAASIIQLVQDKISEHVKGDFDHLKDDITLVVIKSVAKSDHTRQQAVEQPALRVAQE